MPLPCKATSPTPKAENDPGNLPGLLSPRSPATARITLSYYYLGDSEFNQRVSMSNDSTPVDDTTEPTKPADNPATSQFAEQAGQQSVGIVREFWDFLRYNKKWWLLPILIVLLLVAGLVLLSGTTAAPFIYTLF